MSLETQEKHEFAQENIINSVEYLVREADRLGLEHIKSALTDALNGVRGIGDGGRDEYQDQQDHAILELLTRFLASDDYVQKGFVCIIKSLEESVFLSRH